MRVNGLGRCWIGVLLWLTPVVAAVADTRLADAVKNRDTQTVHALLQQRAAVNTPQADGTTALHWAVHWNDQEIAELLLRAGANPNATTELGVTPLSLACINGNAAIVDALLKAGANPNAATAGGETALMIAARSGSVLTVNALFEHGAEVNAKESRRGQTALMWAVAEDHPEIAKILIEHGSDANARSATGFSPLLFAARAGSLESARLLVAAGADVNAAAPDGSTALLVAGGSLVATTTGQQIVTTPSAHESLATFLLDQGANPDLADDSGHTALHFAVQTGKRQLVTKLLAHRASPNGQITMPSPRQMFSLVDEMLWEAGATPIFMAAKAADADFMRALAAAGANTSLATKNKSTPLMAAAGVGRTEGQTLVTENKALEAVKVALDLGADINAANDEGWTALHGAAYNGADTVVRLLAEKGATLDVKDALGRTPLSIAEGAKVKDTIFVVHQSTADLLRRLGARLGLKETEAK